MKADEVSERRSAATPLGKRELWLVAVPAGILLNLGIGMLLQLPRQAVFGDAVGTITVTILLGIPAGITTGVLSSLLGWGIFDPLTLYFTSTQAAIAVFVGAMSGRAFFRSVPETILTGILLGVVAAAVSAPVIAALYADEPVTRRFFFTGLAWEPLYRSLQCLVALGLLRSLPRELRNRFLIAGYVRQNFKI